MDFFTKSSIGYIYIGIALALIALGFAGGRYSAAVTTANAKLATAQCGEARAGDTANANAASAEAVASSATGAAKADDKTNHQETARATGYASALTEANHAQPPKTVVTGIDPHPLRLLFDGMRKSDAAASGPNRDGLSLPAINGVP